MIRNIRFTEITALVLIYFSAAVRLYDNLNPIALYGLIPAAFFLSFFASNSLKENRYIKLLLILYAWVGIAYLGAEYVDSANRQMKQILGVILLCVTIANLGKNQRLIPYLYIVYIILLACAWEYAQEHILNVTYDFTEDRLNDDKLNANTMAYFLFFATVSSYFLGEIFNNRHIVKVLRIIFIGTIPISFFTAVLTASRQVLIIQIPLIALLLLLRYNIKNIKSTIIFIAILITAVCVFIDKGTRIYEDSYLKERAEMDIEDDSRIFLYKDAIRVGLNNPILGVGPGNYIHYCPRREFSHCTYTELFANTGFLGCMAYIYMVLIFIKLQWRRYRKSKDKFFLIFFVSGAIFIADNFFYVFYQNLWLMSFFILLATHSESYFNSQQYAYIQQKFHN